MLQQSNPSDYLVASVESFLSKAEAFLKNHYAAGSDHTDIQKMLAAIRGLQLDVDEESLEQEFELVQERQDLLADCNDSAWF